MIRVFGSPSLGSHSDVEGSRDAAPRWRRRQFVREREILHGPVIVLMKDGKWLDEPEIIPVRREDSAA